MKVLIYNKATDQYRYVHFGKPPCSVLRLFTRGFFPGISTDLSAYILCFCDIGSLASLLGVSWYADCLAYTY